MLLKLSSMNMMQVNPCFFMLLFKIFILLWKLQPHIYHNTIHMAWLIKERRPQVNKWVIRIHFSKVEGDFKLMIESKNLSTNLLVHTFTYSLKWSIADLCLDYRVRNAPHLQGCCNCMKDLLRVRILSYCRTIVWMCDWIKLNGLYPK